MFGSFLVAAVAAKAPPSAAAKALPSAATLPAAAVPQAAQPPPAPAPQTGIAASFPWATHTIAGVFVVSAILLIILLAVQTTKQEGLTGSIGGRVESTYRGRLGGEELLKRWTGFVAVAFVVTAFVLSMTGI